MQQRLGLRLGERARLHRREPGRREHGPPRQLRRLINGRTVAPDHALLNSRLDQEPLDLARRVWVRAHGVQGLELEHGGLERLEQVRGEGELRAVAATVDSDDDLGA